jgi:hypothetical protein
MRRLSFTRSIAVLALVIGIAAGCAQAGNLRHQASTGITPAAYSRAVFQICANALLFEGSHSLGTREGTLAAAADIRPRRAADSRTSPN